MHVNDGVFKDNLVGIPENISLQNKEITKLKEEIKGEPKSLKEMEKNLREIISDSEKSVQSVISGKPSPIHKGIMEQMRKTIQQHEGELNQISKSNKTLGHEIKAYTPKIDKSSEKLVKMEQQVKKTQNLNFQSSAFIQNKNQFEKSSKFYHNITGSRKKEGEIILKRENKILKEDFKGKAAVIQKTVSNTVSNQSSRVQTQKEAISNLQVRQSSVQSAAKKRLELANEISKSLIDIDNAIKENEQAIKHSSPNLQYTLIKKNNNLESQKKALEKIGNELINEGFDLSTEESRMDGKLESFNEIQQNINEQIGISTKYRKMRPEKSSLARPQSVIARLSTQRFSMSLFEKTNSESKIKEINSDLGTQIKNFNQELKKFAEGVLDDSKNLGEVYGELENLKSKIDKTVAKLEDSQINQQNKDDLKNLENNFESFSNVENTQFASADFLTKPVEKLMKDDIRTISNAIKHLEKLDKDINFSKKNNNESKVNELTNQRNEYKKRAIEPKIKNEAMEHVLNKFKNGESISESYSSAVSQYRKIQNALESDDIAAVKELSDSFLSTSGMSSQEIGNSIKVAYERGVETADKTNWAEFDPLTKGVSRMVPEINMDNLNLLFSAMVAVDSEKQNEYKTISDHLSNISQQLEDLKSNINKSTPNAAQKKIENLKNNISQSIDDIKKIEFGLNENNKFTMDSGNEGSFGDFNKEKALAAFSSVNTSLGYIEDYLRGLPEDQPIFTEKSSAEKIEVKNENGSYSIEGNGDLKIDYKT